jgi:hypothetical protein
MPELLPTWSLRRSILPLIPFSPTSSSSSPSTTLALLHHPSPAMMAHLLGRPTIFSAPCRPWPVECTPQRTLSHLSRLPVIGRTPLVPRRIMAWAISRSLLTPPLLMALLLQVSPVQPRIRPPEFPIVHLPHPHSLTMLHLWPLTLSGTSVQSRSFVS